MEEKTTKPSGAGKAAPVKYPEPERKFWREAYTHAFASLHQAGLAADQADAALSRYRAAFGGTK